MATVREANRKSTTNFKVEMAKRAIAMRLQIVGEMAERSILIRQTDVRLAADESR